MRGFHRAWVLTILCCGARAPGDFSIVDPVEFNKILAADSDLVKISGGFVFLEGAVWSPAEGRLVFSDNQNNRLHQWSPAGGVTLFRDPSQAANGNTRDVQGRLLTCEQALRRVSRTESDGSIVDLVSLYNAKKFNSPNDIAVKSDGTVWFTDPDYGLGGGTKEQPGNYVYRLDPSTGTPQAVATDFLEPNGLCFSPDESKLYITDTEGTRHHIRVFDVQTNGTITGGGTFATVTPGVPDGLRCDQDGRVFTSAGDGVQVFLPNGTRIGTILIPESPANVCFGGVDGKTLFITARTGLYSIHLAVLGSGVAGGVPLAAVGGGGGGGGGCGATGLEGLLLVVMAAALGSRRSYSPMTLTSTLFRRRPSNSP